MWDLLLLGASVGFEIFIQALEADAAEKQVSDRQFEGNVFIKFDIYNNL